MLSFRDRAVLPLAIVSSILGWGACSPDVLNPTDDTREATFFVVADVSATLIATVVVEVTAPNITTPLVFNIPIFGTTASGTITVPVGLQRTIAMRAFDVTGIETHSGSVTIDVVAGPNPTVTLTLLPVTGDVEIIVTLGTITVTVVPAADTLTVGGTVPLTARIVDASGAAVQQPVQWASLDPAVATVTGTTDSTAVVTAEAPGIATIVATVAGVGNGATIVVSAPPALQLVQSGLTQPIFVTAPPGDLARLFVVTKTGLILVIRDGNLLPTPFLDLSAQVSTSGDFGLFSMAFHPDYATNGIFFVNYVSLANNATVERYTVSAAPDVGDPASAQLILSESEPANNHNVNLLAFGADGMLYVSFGDGGSGFRPNGQDRTNVHGSILRIDVNGALTYVIPPDNPFFGDPDPLVRQEIWTYGLRNPWRMSFDRLTGDLYIADNGQSLWEEVDVQLQTSPGGENYGWDVMEGNHCFDPPTGCDQTGLVLPTLEYGHGSGACSVIGGYVYRGTQLPALVGHYFYADFCAGWVRSFRLVDGAVVDQRDYTPEFGALSQIVSFGEDAQGELYIVSLGGNIHRIVPMAN